MEFRDFEQGKWKKRVRGNLKTTHTDLIKLKRRSTRRYEIWRTNRINYTRYKRSLYLRDFRLLTPSRRGFRNFSLLRSILG